MDTLSVNCDGMNEWMDDGTGKLEDGKTRSRSNFVIILTRIPPARENIFFPFAGQVAVTVAGDSRWGCRQTSNFFQLTPIPKLQSTHSPVVSVIPLCPSILRRLVLLIFHISQVDELVLVYFSSTLWSHPRALNADERLIYLFPLGGQWLLQ